MATLSEMTERVRDALRDSEKTFLSDTSIGNWLNEAQLDVNARLGVLKKGVDDTFDVNGKDTLPTDFLREDALYIATEESTSFNTPQFTNDEVFLSWKNGPGTPPGTLARIHNEKIETFPIAANKSYTMEYFYKPTRLEAGPDVSALPEELHVRLINYARAHAKWVEGEQGEGDRYWTLYTEGLPSAPTGLYRTRPGPFGFVAAPSYWDSEM